MEHTGHRPSTIGLPGLTAEGGTTGYLHPDYAGSLAEYGVPRGLPYSGGWLLERPIPDSECRDAMGCYPLFTCRRWEQLHADIAELPADLVTVVLVTDPFAPVDRACLEGCFDFVKPFKRHYVADLTAPFQDSVSKHHRYYTKRSRREIEVEVCREPSRYAREWVSLYDDLIKKHQIQDLRAFSPECLCRQLTIPGMVLVVGRQRDRIVGAHLVAEQGDVAYSHLAAFSPLGYQTHASYGIYWATLDYLASRGVGCLDLGGAAGLEDTPTDGLSQFKRGWSSATRVVYLCGRVLDPQNYAEICRRKGIGSTTYFPAYRADTLP